MGKRGQRGLYAVFILLSAASMLSAQRNRIQGALDAHKRVTLSGQVHARAIPANDQGPAEAELRLQNLTLVLKPSAQQQTDLEAFLARQQDTASPDYHHWLTPEEYADRFGVSQADADRITAWLRSENLTVIDVARGRNSVRFSGPVRTVENAFKTSIHRYVVNGELHFANSTEPSVPAGLTGMVAAIHGLHDFRPQTRKIRFNPNYTSAVDGTTHYLTPDDIATIYDIRPLHNAGVDGAGQKIVIVGQTRVDPADIRQFRNAYNLAPLDPQLILVPGLPDPGVVSSDLGEADLDIEWSGAVARKANIIYVYSQDVTDAVFYAIDQNLAPVLSMSYGLCETLTGRAELNSLQVYAQRANAQGMTWLAASGDSGGADCFDSTSRTTAQISVDSPASLPEVTGVGGTEFNEGSGTYWNLSNDGNLASVNGYIPEMVWNDSVADNSPSSGGGGASAFFSKPAWQTGPGVPADGARDVPDISLTASASHDGFLYFSGGARGVVGGTSVSTPVFAGILALASQYQMANGFQSAPGMGNINPQLYSMAQTSPAAFHDVSTGDNLVNPCPTRNRNCGAAQVGYSAGPGYDLASGLGSIDAFNFVTGWHLKSSLKAAVLTLTSSSSSIPLTGSAELTATVSGTGGTPGGTVTWSLAGIALGSATLSGGTANSTAKLTVPASALGAGIVSVSATYSGDATFAAAAGSISVTVIPNEKLTITGVTNAASFQQKFAPGMIVAVFGTAMAGAAQSAPLVPLPTQLSGVTATVNGYLSPLYFISPTQLNVQIPYFITPGPAVLKVNYNGQTANVPITVASAAPGIFTNPATNGPVPNETAHRGDTITLFVTGEGAVTPAPSTGNVPTTAAIPKPIQTVGVTVGGTAAALTFTGIPGWAIGLTQVNYTVPMTAPVGAQPVVVSVGGVQSAPATLTVIP